MGKNKNIFFQIKTACEFTPFFDKHSDKRQDHDNSHVIKSLQSKTNILDFAHQFSDYIKTEYPETKKVSGITSEMCQSFIDKKCSEGCTEKTVKAYQSLLNKIEICVNHRFHSNVNYRTEINKELIQERTSIKDFAFTNAEMEKILDYKGRSQCIDVVKFNSVVGCRINTCDKIKVQDVSIKNNDVFISIRNDKGGRFRTVVIENNKEFANFCRELRSGKNPNDRLFNVKSDSVNKFIRRRCSALGIKTPDGQVKSGNHSIRKNVATNLYRKTGSGSTVSQFLGHGKCRPDIERAYIKDGV